MYKRQEERGVGLSRNTALLFAEEDIVLFSDEDIRFDEGYEKKVLEAFLKNPDADVITFNFRVDERRATYHNAGERRIRWYKMCIRDRCRGNACNGAGYDAGDRGDEGACL